MILREQLLHDSRFKVLRLISGHACIMLVRGETFIVTAGSRQRRHLHLMSRVRL